ncbi:hypothetical protein Purlil1_6671 [Purpureocillium lilacinum]|uniref:Uncharacterized protein n=1 Tax=Purpureocillium lilacinum TaxID=33203 RepID=A0ABR0BZ89_PURLI|nr:hypothetical protein Purlil1_6671 [Purpureocillium lilacinum]
MRHGRAPALSRSPARTLRHPPSLSFSRWPARSPGLNLSCYCAALPRANRAPRTRDDTGYPRASGSRTRAAREPPIRPPGAPRKDPRAGRRGVGGGRGALPDLSLPFCAVQREMPGTAGSVGRGFLGTWGESGGGGAGGRARGSGLTPRACGWLSQHAAVAGDRIEMWLASGAITCQVSPANPSCRPPPTNAPGGSCHVRQHCPARLAGCLAGDPPQTPDGCLSGGAGAGGACAFHAIHGCSFPVGSEPRHVLGHPAGRSLISPDSGGARQTCEARAPVAPTPPNDTRNSCCTTPYSRLLAPDVSLSPPEVGPLLATAAQLYFLCSPPSRLINLLLLLSPSPPCRHSHRPPNPVSTLAKS